MSCVLAIDLGTGGPKVGLVTAAGHVLGVEFEPAPDVAARRRRSRAEARGLVGGDHRGGAAPPRDTPGAARRGVRDLYHRAVGGDGGDRSRPGAAVPGDHLEGCARRAL